MLAFRGLLAGAVFGLVPLLACAEGGFWWGGAVTLRLGFTYR